MNREAFMYVIVYLVRPLLAVLILFAVIYHSFVESIETLIIALAVIASFVLLLILYEYISQAGRILSDMLKRDD